MEVSQNYKDHIKGKARLEHAVHIDPTDKAQNMIKANINRRFWIYDYNEFKNRYAQDKPFKDVNENVIALNTDKTFSFAQHLTSPEVNLYKIPVEMHDSDTMYIEDLHVYVNYTATLIIKVDHIHDVHFKLDSVKLRFKSVSYDDDSDEIGSEDYDITLVEPKFDEISHYEVNYLPFKIDSLDINCKNTMNTKAWVISGLDFGKTTKDYD